MKSCPICQGAGLLPQGFKNAVSLAEVVRWEQIIPIENGEPKLGEVCQPCNGSGKIR